MVNRKYNNNCLNVNSIKHSVKLIKHVTDLSKVKMMGYDCFETLGLFASSCHSRLRLTLLRWTNGQAIIMTIWGKCIIKTCCNYRISMTELTKNRKRWKGNTEVQTVTQLVVLKWGKNYTEQLDQGYHHAWFQRFILNNLWENANSKGFCIGRTISPASFK